MSSVILRPALLQRTEMSVAKKDRKDSLHEYYWLKALVRPHPPTLLLYKCPNVTSPSYRGNASDRKTSLLGEARPTVRPAQRLAKQLLPFFFSHRATGLSGCHGFLGHDAAPLMQWRCTVQGKINRETPSSQLLSSWAPVPYAVSRRANQYLSFWTGGS
ncbi:hypothetical protein ATANTOWER_024127 [Ataeniobius toweri]|uniref:Uncharacterized protein n=1 Tax=Ataeniobius toweri TaxID=208326 RepID=A0ABU7AU61_9TELE|nr:hypothetical protein [Ataeniobius toweri]